MGEHWKIKPSKLKKRPKKRGPYAEKPHDPKKEKTNKEKDKIFGGYLELDRLARGVVEEDSFVPPDNWGELMSSDKGTQDAFRRRLKELEKQMSDPDQESEVLDDVEQYLKSKRAQISQEIGDRFQSIQDKMPEFHSMLSYLLVPIIKHESEFQAEYGIEERRTKKSKANTPVSKLSPEQIQKMCRSRFGLMTMEDLLKIIDRIKRAEQGKIGDPRS